MKSTLLLKNKRRDRRAKSVRRRIGKYSGLPRLSVHRSTKHISAQVINDLTGVTLVSASTTESALRSDNNGNVEAASKVGALLAERAKALMARKA